LDELLPLIARHDAVVSMRYHGLLLAALAGRPAVAVAAHGKVAALGRALGVPVLSPEAAEASVRQALRASFDGREHAAGRAAALVAEARRGLESMAEELRKA
jgi:polysaccharide pyruvyl transferase WcaK-like protein